jgi:hypothetical protein
MSTKEALFEVKFLMNIDFTDDCWLWEGPTQKDGYGQLGWDGATRPAHRVAWKEWIGPIPNGYQIDHLCEVRNCVKPEHLEPVTKRENARRMVERKGWVEGGIKYEKKPREQWKRKPTLKEKTHCSRGHVLSEVGIYEYNWKGKMMYWCKLCRAIRKCNEIHSVLGCNPTCAAQLYPMMEEDS